MAMHELWKLLTDEIRGITSCSDSPNVAKVLLILPMVTSDVDDLVMCTSIHIECASMRIRNMCPKKGPA